LMQNNKVESFPVVAIGGNFWGSVRRFILDTLVSEGTISPSDLDLIHLTDSLEEVMAIIPTGIQAELEA